MSKYNLQNNLKLLDALNVDVWIKKTNIINNRKSYIVKIFILDNLYNNHKSVVDNFPAAACKNLKDLKIDFLNKESIFNIINTDFVEAEYLNISLILCDDNFKNEACSSLVNCNDVYKNSSNSGIYLFNTSLVSDKITNDIKKLIWKDFIYIANYE